MDSVTQAPEYSAPCIQRALAASSWEQLLALVPLLQPHVALVDLNRRCYVAASEAYRNLMQLPTSERALDEAHPGGLAQQLQRYLDRVQNNSAECRAELTLPLEGFELRLNICLCAVNNIAGRCVGALICIEAERRFSLAGRQAAEQSLVAQIIDLIPDLIYYKDANGVYERCNHAFCHALGLDHNEIVGARAEDILPADVAALANRGDQEVLATGAPHHYEGWVDLPRCGRTWFKIIKQPLFDDDGQISGIIAVAHDMTRERRDRQKLSEASLMFETVNDACLILTEQGRLTMANPAAQQRLGLGGDCEGRHVDELVSLTEAGSAAFSRLLGEERWQGEVLAGGGDAAPALYRASLHRVPDDRSSEGTWLLILTDPARLDPSHHRLLHRAYHDPLTGLPNRELVRARLEHSVHQSGRQQTYVAVLYLDLDGFKQINDRFGHLEGDRLLVDVARSMASQVRQGDTLGRIGGDEFIAVLEQIEDIGDIRRVCEKLMAAVTATECRGETGAISASIGVAIAPDDGSDVERLIDCADRAMYEAKRQGRRTVCFYSTLDVE